MKIYIYIYINKREEEKRLPIGLEVHTLHTLCHNWPTWQTMCGGEKIMVYVIGTYN